MGGDRLYGVLGAGPMSSAVEFAPSGPCHFRTIWWCWIANDPFQPEPAEKDRYRCPLCKAETPAQFDTNGNAVALEIGWLSIHRIRATMGIHRTTVYKDEATIDVKIIEGTGYWRRPE